MGQYHVTQYDVTVGCNVVKQKYLTSTLKTKKKASYQLTLYHRLILTFATWAADPAEDRRDWFK